MVGIVSVLGKSTLNYCLIKSNVFNSDLLHCKCGSYLTFTKAINNQAKLETKDRECPPSVLSWPLTEMEELPRSWFGSRSSIQYKHLQLSFPRSYRHWFPLERFPCRFLRSILQSDQLCECCCLFFLDLPEYASHHQWQEVCDIPHHWRWKTIANSIVLHF